MVLTRRDQALVPAIVVPDEQSWAIIGRDPAALGAEPVSDPGAARRVLLPDRVPEPLAGSLAELVGRLPGWVAFDIAAGPESDGTPTREIVAGSIGGDAAGPRPGPGEGGPGTSGHGGDGEAEEPGAGESGGDGSPHGGHGGHDDAGAGGGHGDMMAIVGEPSADGLVMESIHVRFGPLATSVPGGLVADVELDGDVVRASEVRSLLVSGDDEGSGAPDRPPAVPDGLAPVAWRVAMTAAAEREPPPAAVRWRRLAAVELERAASHLAWLRSLGRLLGWRPLIDACTTAIARLPHGGHLLEDRESAQPRGEDPDLVAGVLDLVGSRRMSLRTRGVAALDLAEARSRGLRGPVARASGVAVDARAEDDLYADLGFEPAVHAGGDALSRALLRAEEAQMALGLARRALERAASDREVDDGEGPAPLARSGGEPGLVEGPRGPLVAQRSKAGWRLSAPGSVAVREAAGAAMVGAEWAAALVALASFDLSPWAVDG